MQTQGDRPNHMSGRCSKELNVQNFSYLMEFSSCSETRCRWIATVYNHSLSLDTSIMVSKTCSVVGESGHNRLTSV